MRKLIHNTLTALYLLKYLYFSELLLEKMGREVATSFEPLLDPM